MKRQPTTASQPAQPKTITRETFQVAYRAAGDLYSARQNYAEQYRDVMERASRVMVDLAGRVEDANGDLVREAANMTQFLTRDFTSNMRLELLARYAAAIQVAQAKLDILIPMLTEDELSEIRRYL